MLQSFFTGLSGMFSFSKSLDNVSNNVANMNTPGYRGTNTFLKSVSGSGGQGYGTSVRDSDTRMAAGEIRQTGNETDVAILGKGMFVLRNDDGELFYTRAGQFKFNEDNILVDSNSGYEVLALSDSNNLQNIDITEQRILPAVATENVELTGNLSSTDEDFELSPVTVYSTLGNAIDLTITFTNPPATSDQWTVEIKDSAGTVLDTGDLRFDTSGSPLTGFNTISSNITIDGASQAINFNFGAPGSLAGTTQFSSSGSNIGVNEVDGNGILGMTSISFEDDGQITLNYSNGDERNGQYLALAEFNNEQDLDRASGSLFRNRSNNNVDYVRADTSGSGKIQGGSLELANIELTQEFADMLIIQRGYQASSQVMSIANELIEQLYNNTRR